MSIVAKRPLHLRAHPDDIEQINQLAKQHKLNRTDYMIKAALGKLDHIGVEARLDEHAERLAQLERRIDLAYG